MFNKLIILLLLLFLFFILNFSFKENFDTKKYDALIISPGGGGTTYFLEYLNKHTNLKYNDIHDKDGLKHMSFNKENKINNVNCDKIIYIYSDPKLAIDSHYRRKWPKQQLLKLGDPYHLKNTNNDINIFKNSVIEKNRDMYGIEKQFDFFLNNQNLNKKILFIDFYNITNTKNKIANFLNIDKHLLDGLSINKRESTYNDNEPPEYIEIYKNLYEKMKQYDGYIK
jgi:hypothetical protein